MPGVFDDLSQLNNLYSQAYSPIGNYGQGLLALAMQQRQERLRAQELEAQRQMNLEREQIQQKAEDARAERADKSMMDRLVKAHDLSSSEEKEKERRDMVQKANMYGANLPADSDYTTAAQAFVKGHGQSYIALNKRAGEALRDISTTVDPKALAQSIANAIASDPSLSKVLTADEREQIRLHPEKIDEYKAKFAKAGAKKYDAFVEAAQTATANVTAALQQQHASKPQVVVAAQTLSEVSRAMDEERKRGGIAPEDEVAAQKAYREAAFPPPPPAPPGPKFVLPGQGAAPAPSASAPPTPPAGPSFPGSDVGQDLRSLFSPIGSAVGNVWQNYAFPSTPSAAPAPAPPPPPAPPTDPSVLARLRFQKWLQDSATTNSSNFPTAYPPYNTNQFTAPLSPSP